VGKLKAGIEAKVAAETGVKKALGDWALGEANTRARALLDDSEPGLADRVQYALADKLVLGKIRAAIGLDRARWLRYRDGEPPTRRCVGFRREAAAGPGDQSGRR
jgi:long-subunit acyl-CoA synthetase (AMP-forming)